MYYALQYPLFAQNNGMHAGLLSTMNKILSEKFIQVPTFRASYWKDI